MILVNGVLIIDEGARRLRWQVGPTRNSHPRMVEEWNAGEVIGKTASDVIRRQIEHGQRTLVVLKQDDCDVVSPNPTALTGGQRPGRPTATDQEPFKARLQPLSWLNPAHRSRGLAFAAECRRLTTKTARCFLPPLLVEDELIGTGEPLRFVYRTGSIPIANHLFFDAIAGIFGTDALVGFRRAG